MSEENTEKTKPEESKTLTKTPKKAPAKKSTIKVDPQDDFLQNFNWHQYQEGIDEIDEKQIKEFEKLVETNFVDTSDENILEGEVIHLTDKDVIIDSKVSLAAYERYYNCDDESEKAQFLSQHVASIKGHIKGLGTKDYQTLKGLKIVVMGLN